MKIALVCPYNMFEHAGGVQEFIVNLAAGLRHKKHEVKIITPKPVGFTGEIPQDYILLGTSRRLNGTLSTVLDVGIEVDGDEIDKVLEREKFDVINFHEPWYPVLPRQISGRSQNAAHVGTFHAALPDSMTAKSIVNLLKPYGRTVAERMHLLTATGPAAASVLLNKSPTTGISAHLVKNLRYIPIAVDINFYKPFKKRMPLNGEGTKTVVFLGRPDKRKGIDWLVKAFQLLVEELPHVHLIIAGDGDRLKTIKQQVKSRKIPNVRFVGRVSDEEKRRLLGNADLTCFPSPYGEGFGIVLIESMAVGNFPLVGNNMGYRIVMKGDGRIGLIDPTATEDFANRMAAFLTNRSLSAMMNRWALESSRQYGYGKVIDQYEAVYKEALDIFRRSKSYEDIDYGKKKKAFSWITVRRHAR